MVKIIGVVLLVYGAIGVAGTIALFWWLTRPQGPLQALRGRLREVAEKLGEGVLAAQRARVLAGTLSDILGRTHDKLREVTPPIRLVSGFLGTVGNFFQTVKALLDSVPPVPVLTPGTMSLPEISFSTLVVTNVRFQEQEIPGTGIKVPKLPPLVDTEQVGFTVGPVVVPTLALSSAQPLAPVGQVLGQAGSQLSQAKGKLDDIANLVDEVKSFTGDAKTTADYLIKEVLDPLPGQIDDVRKNVLAVSQSKLLVLLPLLGLGYFGLIHLAFALTGLALIVV